MRYTIKVWTQIFKNDVDEPWCKLGTPMVWPNVSDDMRVWLAGSCSTTALWLTKQPEVVDGDRYTVMYRTLVLDEDLKKITDSGDVPFPNLTYQSVCAFELWALDELRKMIDMFAAEHNAHRATTKTRGRLRTLWAIYHHIRQNRRA